MKLTPEEAADLLQTLVMRYQIHEDTSVQDFMRLVDIFKSRAEKAETELAALKEQQRWIPVSERLPEIKYGTRSSNVEVLYRYKWHAYGNEIMHKHEVVYHENGTWEMDWSNGEMRSFEYYGFEVIAWRAYPSIDFYLSELPKGSKE
ncbi:MAG: hypothetical protein ABFD50_02285 [Smithella sp.]